MSEHPAQSASLTSGPETSAQPQEAGFFSLLHVDPVILYAWDSQIREPESALWSVLEALPEQASYLIVGPSFSLSDRAYRESLAARVRHVSRRFDSLEVVANCPTADETALLRREGVAALHCSTGALVRDDFFKPSRARQPVHDAIYDAKWTDIKRHDLAGRVRSLALIAPPPWMPAEECTFDYFHRAHAAVKHATWISNPWGSRNARYLSYEEINAAYNQARVGLCLSRYEGAMVASVQYLLAGLPVVTTHNIGGRDEFFDPAYVRWVDDDPGAVATAVAELIALDLDPQMIRDATLVKIRQHRDRMQAWIRHAIETAGGEPGRWAGDWPGDLPNKLREPLARSADVIAQINAADA